MASSNGHRRVVVTGLGVVSPVGLTVEENWESIVAGRSGLGPITHFDAQGRGFGLVDYVLNAEPAVQAPAAAMNAG